MIFVNKCEKNDEIIKLLFSNLQIGYLFQIGNMEEYSKPLGEKD